MISERLRDNYMPMRGGFGAWHIDPLSLEAAEVIDALVATVDACLEVIPSGTALMGVTEAEYDAILGQADAALAMARRK